LSDGRADNGDAVNAERVRRGFGVLLLTVGALAPALAAVDADAARALAKRNNCFKCHAIDKVKKGPAYKRIAARLRAKSDAVEVIVEHLKSGRRVEMADGSEEEHRIIDSADSDELQNLARWILSL
jgi:cytochrome c